MYLMKKNNFNNIKSITTHYNNKMIIRANNNLI